MEDLRAVLVGLLVQRPVEARASRCKGPRRDIILEELLVHDVHNGRREGLDVLGPCDERFDIICITETQAC